MLLARPVKAAVMGNSLSSDLERALSQDSFYDVRSSGPKAEPWSRLIARHRCGFIVIQSQLRSPFIIVFREAAGNTSICQVTV